MSALPGSGTLPLASVKLAADPMLRCGRFPSRELYLTCQKHGVKGVRVQRVLQVLQFEPLANLQIWPMLTAMTKPTLTSKTPLASGLRHRPARERGMAEHGWLNSAHSFSFANYYDPEHMGFANLRVINDDRVAPERGFGEHPHKNAEIFSYVLSGALAHKDTMRNSSIVTAGGVQYMSAGSGVRHSEFNPSADEPVHFLQIWLLPNQDGGEPRYETLDLRPADKAGQLKLFLSPDGRDGSLAMRAEALIYAGTFDGSQTAETTLEDGHKGWIQVARGSVDVNGQRLEAGDGLGVSGSGRIFVSQGIEAEILYFDLFG